jgi:hypothetical protein
MAEEHGRFSLSAAATTDKAPTGSSNTDYKEWAACSIRHAVLLFTEVGFPRWGESYPVLESSPNRDMGHKVSDAETLQEILRWIRIGAQRQMESLRIQFLQYWGEEMKKPRNADPKRLLRHGFKVYSQNDEDGILEEVFRRIGVAGRRFVEFGVQSGFECNTAKLLVEGWQGCWMEADGAFAAKIRAHFTDFLSLGKLQLLEEMVTAENINALLSRSGMTGDIDLLCIDIDFNDYWVWKAIEVTKPRVVSIEYNASLRPPLSLVVPYDPKAVWRGGNYFGASLEALVKLAREKGYCIVGCGFAGVNAFFVRQDLCKDLFLEPATAEEHYEPPRYFSAVMPSGHPGKPGPYMTV